MNSPEPPRLAVWMLDRFIGGRNEALAGDLLESFRAGRSRSWYWRQTFVAIALEWTRSLFRHRSALIFAAMWSLLSPAWQLILIRLQNQENLGGLIWRIPWPWSTVCFYAWFTAENMVFVWAGALVYALLLVITLGPLSGGRIARRFVASVAVFTAASASLIAWAMIANPHPAGHGVDVRTLTLSHVITNFAPWTLAVRLPYFFGTACVLWGFAPRAERSAKLVE